MAAYKGMLSNGEIKLRIRNIAADFVNAVNPVRLSDWLIQDGVITVDEWHAIDSKEHTKQDKCRNLLHHLLKSSHPMAFSVVLKALENDNHYISQKIKDLPLELEYQTEKKKLSDNLTMENKKLVQEKIDLTKEIEKLKREYEQDKKKLRLENESLATENKKYFKDNEDLMKAKENLAIENKKLVQNKKDLTNEIEKLREHNQQNKKLQEEKENLASENRKLVQEKEKLMKEIEELLRVKERIGNENKATEMVRDGATCKTGLERAPSGLQKSDEQRRVKIGAARMDGKAIRRIYKKSVVIYSANKIAK